MSFLGALCSNPGLVLRHRNIFLLSHMRANTSLFGHLMGSHPLVEGYYEMHIGYHSWRSLWRQKLRHFAQHSGKAGARYMFDKVLHDGHFVAPQLLQRASSQSILMLRQPEQSIRSLIVLYREQSPHLPEATPEGAARYYIDRLATLGGLAGQLGGRYFYLDAEALIGQTDLTLARLSRWLDFDTPIPSTYETFSHTGRGNAGDHSSRLRSGQIDRARSDYSNIVVPAALMQEAVAAHAHQRQALMQGAADRAVITP
jgi:hypothetical protein